MPLYPHYSLSPPHKSLLPVLQTCPNGPILSPGSYTLHHSFLFHLIHRRFLVLTQLYFSLALTPGHANYANSTRFIAAASAKDPDTHMGDPNTHEKDSGTRGRKGIPQKLTFRHNTSKSSKMKDIDQERLRTQLIEEAKQRKFLGQAASNREARITQTGGVHWISRD